MKEFVISEAQVETAILVGLITQTQDERKTKEYLDELEFLAETAGATVVKRFTQKLPAANSVTYVGKGKLEEIKEYIHQEEENEREVGMVIFDDELSAKQIRNIEAELKVKILDRTSLILDIFAMRAQTANAKTQVELAQYKYMLPRLQRLWTHLERQGGGSGAGGGKAHTPWQRPPRWSAPAAGYKAPSVTPAAAKRRSSCAPAHPQSSAHRCVPPPAAPRRPGTASRCAGPPRSPPAPPPQCASPRSARRTALRPPRRSRSGVPAPSAQCAGSAPPPA